MPVSSQDAPGLRGSVLLLVSLCAWGHSVRSGVVRRTRSTLSGVPCIREHAGQIGSRGSGSCRVQGRPALFGPFIAGGRRTGSMGNQALPDTHRIQNPLPAARRPGGSRQAGRPAAGGQEIFPYGEKATKVYGWLYRAVVKSLVDEFGGRPVPRTGGVDEFGRHQVSCQGSIEMLLVKGAGHAADVEGRAVRGDPA